MKSKSDSIHWALHVCIYEGLTKRNRKFYPKRNCFKNADPQEHSW